MRRAWPRVSVSIVSKIQTARRKDRSVAGRGDPTAPPVFTNILCAVDGTRASTAAVEDGRLAGGAPRVDLTLLTVTAVKGSGPYATAAISPSRVKQMLSRARSIADDAGVHGDHGRGSGWPSG